MKIINIKNIEDTNFIEDLKNKNIVFVTMTDTVMGLICNAENEEAVRKIYDIKKRDHNKAISIFVKDIEQIENIAVLDDKIKKIIEDNSPGSLTVILKKKNKNYLSYMTNDNIGVRIPNAKHILKILDMVDFPLAQTSSNISDNEVCKNLLEVEKVFGDKIDYYVLCDELDSIKDDNNLASTIIDYSNGDIEIIREGKLKIGN